MAGGREDLATTLSGLGQGLLSVSGPSYQPQSIGTGIGRGLGLASEMARQQKLQELEKMKFQDAKRIHDAQLEKYGLESQALRNEQERAQAFRNLLSGGESAPQTVSNAQLPAQESQFLPMQGQGMPSAETMASQESPVVSQDALTNANQPSIPPQAPKETTTLNEGNPSLYKIDDLYNRYPQYRDYFNKQGFKLSRQIKQSPETGQTFIETTYPSGKVVAEAVQVGKSPGQVQREKEFSKSDAKVYDRAQEAFQNVQGALDNLDYITELVQTSPNFKNVVGPVNSVLTNWAGSPEDRDLLGNINSAVGNIVLDAAKSIKGAFTGRDISLINSIKPNVNDRVDVFKGKLAAMKILSEAVAQRNQRIISLIREDGYSPDKAIAKARQDTDLKDIRKQIAPLLKSGSNLNKSERKVLVYNPQTGGFN